MGQKLEVSQEALSLESSALVLGSALLLSVLFRLGPPPVEDVVRG